MRKGEKIESIIELEGRRQENREKENQVKRRKKINAHTH